MKKYERNKFLIVALVSLALLLANGNVSGLGYSASQRPLRRVEN